MSVTQGLDPLYVLLLQLVRGCMLNIRTRATILGLPSPLSCSEPLCDPVTYVCKSRRNCTFCVPALSVSQPHIKVACVRLNSNSDINTAVCLPLKVSPPSHPCSKSAEHPWDLEVPKCVSPTLKRTAMCHHALHGGIIAAGASQACIGPLCIFTAALLQRRMLLAGCITRCDARAGGLPSYAVLSSVGICPLQTNQGHSTLAAPASTTVP